jgi:hypothetical protein
MPSRFPGGKVSELCREQPPIGVGPDIRCVRGSTHHKAFHEQQAGYSRWHQRDASFKGAIFKGAMLFPEMASEDVLICSRWTI